MTAVEITLSPPWIVLYLALGIFAAAIAPFYLLQAAREHRPLGIAIAVVGVGLLLVVGFRSPRFAWGDAGIRDDTDGPTLELAWSEIREARLVHGVWGSHYGPTGSKKGAYCPACRAGRYDLANGKSARVFVMNTASDALLLRTANDTFLYAPPRFDEFLAALEAHHPDLDGR